MCEDENMKTMYCEMELYVKYTYESVDNKEPVGISIKIVHIPKDQSGTGNIADLYYFKGKLASACLTIVYGKDVPDHSKYFFDKFRTSLLKDDEYMRCDYMLPGILKDKTIHEAFSWDDVILETFKKPAEKGTHVYVMTVLEWHGANHTPLWNRAYQSVKDAETAFYRWRKECVSDGQYDTFDYSIEQLEVC